MTIRTATDNDFPHILTLHRAAFGADEGPIIRQLVAALHADASAQPLYSFVADQNQSVVGHILFTPVHVDAHARPLTAYILAPLAVDPGWQRQGIGRQLIEHGCRTLATHGVDLIYVLGSPKYYPKFGFAPIGAHGVQPPYPVPYVDAWMCQAYTPDSLSNAHGTLRCADALNQPEYW